MRLAVDARRVACDVFRQTLEYQECDIGAIAVGATHYHVIARFGEHNPRKLVGIAKKRSARALSEQRLVEQGGVWAVRSRAVGINDQGHLRTACRYVARHSSQGAAVSALSINA